MNKNTFLKIWKDPVLSKVIAVGIIALLTVLYSVITSITDEKGFKTVLVKFWTTPIELWVITIAILIFVLVAWGTAVLLRRPYKYDAETLELDRGLFSKIRNEILPQDVICQVKQSSFAENNFHSDLLFKVLDILDEERKSDFHFFNPLLDKYKKRLINEIENFRQITGSYIFGAPGDMMLGVPREWMYEQPERFKEAVRKIYDQELILLSAYDEFIRSGKQILRV